MYPPPPSLSLPLSSQDPNAAEAAPGFFDGTELKGQVLKVTLAKQAVAPPGGGYGGGGGKGGKGGYGGKGGKGGGYGRY
jgi:RNA-binding protein FUS